MSAVRQLERLVDIKELSDLSGLTVREIREAKDNKGLPFHKVGIKLKFYPSEFAEWIVQQKKVNKK